ncbi:hypothetical protein ACIBFB_05675 [Nocardiopsis sp. NPDC050513]|uniref:hypothetical protein n=1 Tax=Nocardiopsis sp. NPDC050513 TaxID=3364338 RepID=UPI00378AB7F3
MSEGNFAEHRANACTEQYGFCSEVYREVRSETAGDGSAQPWSRRDSSLSIWREWRVPGGWRAAILDDRGITPTVPHVPVPLYPLVDAFDGEDPSVTLDELLGDGRHNHVTAVKPGAKIRLPEPFGLELDTSRFPGSDTW